MAQNQVQIAPSSRTREQPQGDEEATTDLKLGEFQGVPTLTLSEARLIINTVIDHRRQTRDVKETEILAKTQDYLDVFARFKQKENIEAVERILSSQTELEMFERSQLGSLCCETAEEAKTLIPSLTAKKSDADLQEVLDELTKLRQFIDRPLCSFHLSYSAQTHLSKTKFMTTIAKAGNMAKPSGTIPPPINRSMRSLDRSFFRKEISLSALRLVDNTFLHKYRKLLQNSGDILAFDGVQSICPDPDPILAAQGRKCLLLNSNVKHDARESWSTSLDNLQSKEGSHLVPYNLVLTYEHWDSLEILQSVLPEDLEEMPTGFTIVGHVAHLNLRDQHLPHKHIIAQVLMDKNPTIRTVINKIDNVGDESVYRTFKYEVLAGENNMNVEVHDGNCTFHFDYSKVYWNTRLNTEHHRIIDLFEPGDAVCDVMAGVGPFAIPAGKKQVFVWANDLNPDSYTSLTDAIERNKVKAFVRSFNEDGRTFIPNAARQLLTEEPQAQNAFSGFQRRHRRQVQPTILNRPITFNHFVMNLPASAITFLDAFRGIYKGHERLFTPLTDVKLPLIHVYCFSVKREDVEEEKREICAEVSARIGHDLFPDTPEVTVWDVRNVAPKKTMFCVSFRLPPEVAFS
ncbi:MAG: tRNA(m(1)G37)methyltransferase [Vezdaea aestivalis]|nr:MAG: tRNA(m(1)G37)methyltransferase [Vezdaea aestivalis]